VRNAIALEDGHLSRVYADLRRLGVVEVETGRAIVCLVGAAPQAGSWVVARAHAILGDIALSSLPQGTPGGNVHFVVEGVRVGEVVTRLHAAFFEYDVVGQETAAPGPEATAL
jgi:aspartokinase